MTYLIFIYLEAVNASQSFRIHLSVRLEIESKVREFSKMMISSRWGRLREEEDEEKRLSILTTCCKKCVSSGPLCRLEEQRTTPLLSHTFSRTHTYTLSHMCSLVHSWTHTHTLTHTHMNMNTRSHTHARTQVQSRSKAMVGSKVARSLHGSYFERKSDLVSVYFRSEKSDLDGADSEEAKNSFILFF